MLPGWIANKGEGTEWMASPCDEDHEDILYIFNILFLQFTFKPKSGSASSVTGILFRSPEPGEIRPQNASVRELPAARLPFSFTFLSRISILPTCHDL
jgi:hypothetical protein